MHHVDDFAGVDVHQQRIVPVAHPAIWPIGRRQAILPRIVQPVARPVIARVQVGTMRPAAIIPAERIVIEAEAEDRAVLVAVAVPVIAPVVAPVLRPAGVIAVTVVAARLARPFASRCAGLTPADWSWSSRRLACPGWCGSAARAARCARPTASGPPTSSCRLRRIGEGRASDCHWRRTEWPRPPVGVAAGPARGCARAGLARSRAAASSAGPVRARLIG